MCNTVAEVFNQEAMKLLEYLEIQSYSQSRVELYRKGLGKILTFLIREGLNEFSTDACKEYIDEILDGSEYAVLNYIQKDYIRVASALLEFQTIGTISSKSKQGRRELCGKIGTDILGFCEYRKNRKINDATIEGDKLFLSRFQMYLEKRGVNDLDQLNKEMLIGYANSLSFYSKSSIHSMLQSLRAFLKYLHESRGRDTDISYFIPKSSYNHESKLPSTYTKDEIDRILQSVDRGNPKGKRDYAMILLAARLGLRASDICGLEFSSICWEQNLIILIQQKTKRRIELPLLQEIGNAIIDYLKYGRPISSLPFIFLKQVAFYQRLSEPTLHSIVAQQMKRAGIDNASIRKHGPHALRHSLAGFLLENKTPIPVISEVLGHINTESTKTYLRIDLQALRQCALEVPQLAISFYRPEVII